MLFNSRGHPCHLTTNHSVLQTYIHKHKTTKDYYTFKQSQYFKGCVSESTKRQSMKILTIIIEENINITNLIKVNIIIKMAKGACAKFYLANTINSASQSASA